MAALITDRELNLSTLARQFLLRRAEVSALDAIEHLAGLQAPGAESALPGAVGAAEELCGRRHLSTLVEKRQVVRLVAMRGTVFALSAADVGPFRATVQTIMERDLHTNSTQRAALTGLDLDALAQAGTRPGSRRAAYPNADEASTGGAFSPATRQKGWHTEFADCCRWCRFHREVCGDDPEHRH